LNILLLFPVVVFWFVIIPFSFGVENYRLSGPCCLQLQSKHGGSMDHWNVGILPQHYTASQPRRPRRESLKHRFSYYCFRKRVIWLSVPNRWLNEQYHRFKPMVRVFCEQSIGDQLNQAAVPRHNGPYAITIQSFTTRFFLRSTLILFSHLRLWLVCSHVV